MSQWLVRPLVIGILFIASTPRPARATSACGSTVSVKYYGGPVVQNPKVVVVFWGANVSATITSTMPAFYTTIVNSSYLDWLSEYNTVGLNGQDGQPGSNQGISRGSFGGNHTITPSLCAGTTACTVSDAQLQTELTQQITAGNLPPPTVGCDGQINTIYAVHFPVNVTITLDGSGSCQVFCYYHNTGTYNGKPLVYTVNPDVTTGPCAGGCGNDATPINNQTSVSSSALFNAITDPNIGLETSTSATTRPIAWYDDRCGEIGTICNALHGTLTVGTQTWTVQKQWSRVANDCVVTRSPLPAICTGAGTPAGCRSCSCADDAQGASGQIGCSGATPLCDTLPASPTYGQCVATGTGGAGGSGGRGGAGGAGGGTAGAAGGSTGGSGGAGASGGTTGGGGAGGATGGSAGPGGTGGATGGAGGSTGGATGGSAGGSGGAGGASGKPDGTEGGACYGNGTCNMGLTCLSHLCVMAPKSGGGGGCGCALGGPRDASALALAALALGFAATRARGRRRRD